MSRTSWGKILGGAMLVAGTCIGAGMLGLPISTAAGGFYPSTIAFLFFWSMMTLSALFMLEVALWHPGDINLITMAKSTLGKPGEVIAWITYVFFLYALMTAYTSGASSIIAAALENFGLNKTWSIWILVTIFATIVYMGAYYVDRINRLLMAGLILAYIALVYYVLPNLSPTLLSNSQPKYLWAVGPLMVTSFGFHLLIPSLKNYMKDDAKALRAAIILGSIVPLIIYLLWEALILGMVPTTGEQGIVALIEAEHNSGKQAVIELINLLTQMVHSAHIGFFAKMFGLCAILTSFVGVALGLFDFFADGFKVKKTVSGRFALAGLTFFPPILIALFYPRFLLALRYAGVFAAILLVLYPAMMVWSGRYCKNLASGYRVWGGKTLIGAIFLFGLSVVILEALHHMNRLPTPLVDKHLFE